MPKEFNARRLEVQAFAEDAASLAGSSPLQAYERLLAETGGRGAEQPVHWSARGELRRPSPVRPEVWLHLEARAVLPLTCQRCLGPVDTEVVVSRDFRFVADEATALAEDDDCEEDLLVLSRSFDLLELVEEELLMAMPLVPRHEICPEPVRLQAQDPGFEHESPRANPFAVLGRLKSDKP